MPTELRHIELSTVTPVAFALGAVNGGILSLPIIWNWIQTGDWITGFEMGVGTFVIGLTIAVLTTAITVVVVALIFAGAYNVVAARFGGIEVRLKQ